MPFEKIFFTKRSVENNIITCTLLKSFDKISGIFKVLDDMT